jgi:hypothetical protein
MNKLVAVTAFLILLISCSRKESNVSQDDRFNTYKESFIIELWKQYPVWASAVGYHDYDSLLPVPDSEDREQELAFASKHMDSLSLFDENSLSDNNQTDYFMIRDLLASCAAPQNRVLC